MCIQQTWRSRSFRISHLRKHLTSLRDTVPKKITLSRLTVAARYSCTQCVDSLCSYLGYNTTAKQQKSKAKYLSI